MRVPVHTGSQPRRVRVELRPGGQPGPGVVQVHVPALVQVRVLGRPKLIKPGRRLIARIRRVEVTHCIPPIAFRLHEAGSAGTPTTTAAKLSLPPRHSTPPSRASLSA